MTDVVAEDPLKDKFKLAYVDGIERFAHFSEDKAYRYTLNRTWDREKDQLVFIMLNPSTADATKDDPTIRRCISFARREGYGGIIVMNLFALRSTDPSVLHDHENPVGDQNDEYLSYIPEGATVVAAWGAHPDAWFRADDVKKLLAGRRLVSLGTTKSGAPRHPLYVKGDTPLTDWS